jgi:hypothetical protein
MKKIHKILIVLMLIFSNCNFAQEFNGYKYVVVSNIDYGAGGKDTYGVQLSVINYFKDRGFQVITGGDEEWSNSLYPKDLKFNLCIGLFVGISHKAFPPYEVTLSFYNCKKETIKNLTGKASANFDNALKRIFTKLDENPTYTFDESLTPYIIYPEVENINKDENELKAYFDSTEIDPIEGIYKTYKSELNLKLAIIKDGDEYKAITLEPEASHWKVGDVKIKLESTAAEGVFSAKWYMNDKSIQETFANLEGGLITVELNNSNKIEEKTTINLLKIYPKK